MTEEKRPLAVVGSPSDTLELTADILESASGERLLGAMLYLDTVQDGNPMCVTGQVTEIILRNRWHEQDLMRNIIKQRGSIPHLSERQDVRSAVLAVGATFSRPGGDGVWSGDTLASVPSTGTPFRRMTQDLLDDLVRQYRDDFLHFGTAYGDDNVRMPMYIKHFGSPDQGGQGEAYHSLIVGKTGSGKSTLAKMMLAGYARHRSMGILVIDPKGEFSDEIRGYQVGESGLALSQVFQGFGRSSRRYGISSIRLDSWSIWEDLANAMRLHAAFNIRGGDNADILIEVLRDIVRKRDIKLHELHTEEALLAVLGDLADGENAYAARIYKTEDRQHDLMREFLKALEETSHPFRKKWRIMASLFRRERSNGEERPSIQSLVWRLVNARGDDKPIIAIDLSAPGNEAEIAEITAEFGDGDEDSFRITDGLQKRVIKHIVDTLVRVAEKSVSERHLAGSRDNANTLVVFEEAHRYAPAQTPAEDEGRRLRAKLIEAVRETRKFGLGWMFIDQTIGGIDKQITQQVRMAYFGYGLSMGSELERLRELAGGDSRDLRLYQSFRDPASYGSAESKRFPWMAIGPVSPMASNRPLFINAFGGRQFVEINDIPLSGHASSRPAAREKVARASEKYRKQVSYGKTGSQPPSLKDLDDDFNFFKGK